MTSFLVLALLLITIAAYVTGLQVAKGFKVGAGQQHSLAGYHGAYMASWAAIPSFLLVLVWLLFQGSVVDRLLLASLPSEMVDGQSQGQVALVLSEIKSVAKGNIFGTPSDAVIEAADRYNAWQQIASWAMAVIALVLAVAGLAFARTHLAPRFRARNHFERIVSGFMIVCSLIAILTTLGIVVSLLYESIRFFSIIPLHEFLFGAKWEPQIAMRADQASAGGAFGAIPVFTGTLLIAVIAMLVATPIGLYAAIYLSEYAPRRVRSTVKPLLEILAGIPTVVYGFFAVLTVAPAMRSLGEALGFSIAPNSALAAGAVMGIMLIPFISSLSDDAISAVPQSLRDGSYGLGATRGETITQVLLPAALPGIMGGILLALSRAIGETMIVVMAAGIIAALTLNPFEPVTTVTVQIVTLLIGDTEFDNPKTLAAFALGLVLFLVTLALNVLALHIVRKYREQYD
ncbi:MAG: phosphate ABC transporter permease subunit PstC [Rhizobiales bacterium]|nr:phosphate ABC transporter permease subunit PstC [Hyphomicrobiales bacterium]